MAVDIYSEFDKAVARAGGIEAVKKELDDFGNRHRELRSRKAELTAKHPRRWVALVEGGEYIFAATRDKLREAIQQAGKSARTAAIDYLDPKPAVMIV